MILGGLDFRLILRSDSHAFVPGSEFRSSSPASPFGWVPIGIMEGISCCAELLEFVLLELVEGSLEVVQDDCVGEAFEDECELPEGIDAVW